MPVRQKENEEESGAVKGLSLRIISMSARIAYKTAHTWTQVVTALKIVG